ncbi:MAG: flagellar biosynthesis anti-sigma factor FlgM [bacterium]|nr:flagellar biosynthesis anti-sigma factor FlgM [bacterium]
MKITGTKPIVNLEQMPHSAQVAKKTPDQNAMGSKVSFSEEAKNLAIDPQKIREALTQVPDVRMDKVNELREAIANGTYNPPVDKVADKMITSSLVESAYRKD